MNVTIWYTTIQIDLASFTSSSQFCYFQHYKKTKLKLGLKNIWVKLENLPSLKSFEEVLVFAPHFILNLSVPTTLLHVLHLVFHFPANKNLFSEHRPTRYSVLKTKILQNNVSIRANFYVSKIILPCVSSSTEQQASGEQMFLKNASVFW